MTALEAMNYVFAKHPTWRLNSYRAESNPMCIVLHKVGKSHKSDLIIMTCNLSKERIDSEIEGFNRRSNRAKLISDARKEREASLTRVCEDDE